MRRRVVGAVPRGRRPPALGRFVVILVWIIHAPIYVPLVVLYLVHYPIVPVLFIVSLFARVSCARGWVSSFLYYFVADWGCK